MQRPSGHQSGEGAGGVAPGAGRPHDRCFRCDRETPPGVGLCPEHNPTGLRGPSTTQMHATIFGGVALGVIGFFVLAGMAVGTAGPFTTDITAAAADPAGGVAVSFTVSNDGTQDGVPDCRVTRDGVPRPDDLSFRVAALPAGRSVHLERHLVDPPLGSVSYVPERISIVCT